MATIKCTVQRSSWYEVYFEYSYTQDKANAKTALTHSLKLKQLTDSYDFDTISSVTVGYKVNGATFSKTGRINIDDKGNKGYTITLASGSSTITHNSSTGIGSFTVSVDTAIESGGYGPGTIKLPSKEVSLPTIYRASKPSITSTARMGGTVTINTNRASSSFTHTIKYTFGGTTATIATGVGASYAWKVPDLASKCNNATSGTATITCITYNGSTTIGTETCTVMIHVPAESVPSASSVEMGNTVVVHTNRWSSNFTHTIELWFAGEKVSTKTSVGASTQFDVPLSLATKIPNDPKGTATILCKTYNGTAQVGSTQTATFVATIPDNNTTKPQFTESGFVLTPTGSLPSKFSGLFVQNQTGVKASFTATSNYSTISEYELEADGRVYTGNPATSRIITTDGNIKVKGTVTDARGYYKEVPKTITVHPYKSPTIEPASGHSSIICERSTQDGTYDDAGTYLHIKCRRKYSSVDGKNICTIYYQYKVAGGSWSSLKTLLDGTNTSTDVYEDTLPDVVSQTDKSYTIRLIVMDAVGSSEPYEFHIATADVALHLGQGGYGVAVGKYSEATQDNKKFESAWDAYFEKDLHANHIARIGRYDNNNFNELTHQTGYYTSTSTPSEVDCSNYPVDKPGVLEVISQMPTEVATVNVCGFAYQTYRTHDGEVYTRSYYTLEGWTPWSLQDGVIESGQSGIWQYKKWASGFSICWGTQTVEGTFENTWGNLYTLSSASPKTDYPITFIARPNEIVNVRATPSACFVYSESGVDGINTTTSTACYRAVRATKVTTSNTVRFDFTVIGRWK